MTESKTYKVEQIGQMSVSNFADALGVYDHIKEGGEDDGQDESDNASTETDPPEDDMDEDSEDEGSDDSDEGDEEAEEDEDEDDDGETEDSDGEEEDEDVEEEVKDEPEAVQNKVKLVAKTKDGKKIVVPRDATVRHKVDGEYKDIPVQELLNDYAGKSAISKRMGEAEEVKREAEFVRGTAQKIVQDYQQTFEAVQGLVAEGKLDSAIDVIARLSGQDPVPYFEKLLEKSMEYAETWGSLDENGKRAWKADQRSRYLERKAQEQAGQIEREGTKRSLDGYILETTKRAGISDAAFYNRVNALAKEGKLVQSDPRERVNYVIGTMLSEKHAYNIEAVSRSFGGRVTPKMKELITRHTSVTDTQDDLRQVIKALLKEEKGKVAKTLSRKVRANNLTPSSKKKASRANQDTTKKVFGSYQDLINGSY